MNRLYYSWAKGNVIDKMAIHHIEVHPIRTTMNRTGRFLTYATKVRSKQ
jgi:hypothetical protein